jgi:hypothetical protein
MKLPLASTWRKSSRRLPTRIYATRGTAMAGGARSARQINSANFIPQLRPEQQTPSSATATMGTHPGQLDVETIVVGTMLRC